jgi:hypothetical protein
VSQEYALAAAGLNMGPAATSSTRREADEGRLHPAGPRGAPGKGVDPHRKLGFIARSTLDADSPYADVASTATASHRFQFRREGSDHEQDPSTATAADFVQLERKGNTSTRCPWPASAIPLTTSQVTELALGDEVYAGLFLCSHNPAVVEKAVFRDVRIIRPAKEGFALPGLHR